MAEIFHIYASHGRYNYVELDLPASDYEMLDMMERLRLEPDQLPYLEVLKFREEYDYLERCVHEQPDIYQLNALARKLSEFTSVQEMAEDVMTDFQLGKFLVENGFIEETNDLTGAALALLDYGKIGREHREAENGVYTGFGYVEQHEEIHCVNKTMDFQPRKPPYTILVNMTAMPLAGSGQKPDVIQLRLPAPEEHMREALEKMGKQDWNDVAVSILDCAIPSLNHELYFNGEMPQILELSQRLSELDTLGELPKYKAILAINDGQELSRMISLSHTVDEYFFEPQISSLEDVALGELRLVISSKDAEVLRPHIDLEGYGRALLMRDQAVITSYGLVKRDQSQ